MKWKPIKTAPKDGTPILGWCDHAANPYYTRHDQLTDYGANVEEWSRVMDGPHVVTWTDAFFDGNTLFPAWWFLNDGMSETVANPTHWLPIPPKP